MLTITCQCSERATRNGDPFGCYCDCHELGAVGDGCEHPS